MEQHGTDTPAAVMRVTEPRRRLRFDAGSLSLNLVATLGLRASTPVERLDTPPRLSEWLDRSGLPARDGAVDGRLLAAARELREAMFELLVASLHGRPAGAGAVTTVNRAARATVPAAVLVPAPSGVDAKPPDGGLTGRQLLAVVARDLVDLLADPGRLAALRCCDSPVCRMIYLDASQGRRRRWCSMRRCGNAAKASGHRARHLTAGTR